MSFLPHYDKHWKKRERKNQRNNQLHWGNQKWIWQWKRGARSPALALIGPFVERCSIKLVFSRAMLVRICLQSWVTFGLIVCVKFGYFDLLTEKANSLSNPITVVYRCVIPSFGSVFKIRFFKQSLYVKCQVLTIF